MEYTPMKIPVIKKYSNIVLKRGIIAGDNDFFEWFDTITLGDVDRRDITINLLNEEHEPEVVRKVKNAFPVKLTGPTLHATKSEIAIETLEIAHTGVVVQHTSSGSKEQTYVL